MAKLLWHQKQGSPSLLLKTFSCSADRFVSENGEQKGQNDICWLLDDVTRSKKEGRYNSHAC
jgi:hypothetical protein